MFCFLNTCFPLLKKYRPRLSVLPVFRSETVIRSDRVKKNSLT